MLRRYALAGALAVCFSGWAMADFNAGMTAYERGNFSAALQNFQSSAGVGDRDAQFMLGRMYAEGEGVRQDFVEAHKWFNLAAARGHREAGAARNQVAARMTPQQIAAAQEAAGRWEAAAAEPAPAPAPATARSAAPEMPYSIRNVQQTLNRLGYDAGPADGVIGPRTRNAVREFQADAGLPVTGQPTRELFAQMLAAASPAAPAAPPAVAAPAVPEQTASSAVVADIQAALRTRGYTIPSVSGRIDSATTAAIRTFQADAGLPVTGRADEALLARLQGTAPGAPAAASPMVADIEAELRRRGYNVAAVDGILDDTTRAAIREYQREHGLAATGEPSEALLANLRATAAADPAVQRDMVRQVQEHLNRRGYSAGPADGTLGPATRTAIRNYQADADLPVTGRVTPALLAHLEGDTTAAVDNRQLIRDIRARLAERGYEVGAGDDVLDPRTEAAIRRYQADAGLTVTGAPTPELLAHLRTSDVVAAPAPPATPEDAAMRMLDDLSRRLLERLER